MFHNIPTNKSLGFTWLFLSITTALLSIYAAFNNALIAIPSLLGISFILLIMAKQRFPKYKKQSKTIIIHYVILDFLSLFLVALR